jgi:molybdate transport system regulatory protein
MHRGEIAIGPGKIELLNAILQTGSLNKAAKQQNLSYMRAWLMVKTMNGAFREPLVEAIQGGKSGGGMTLTTCGLKVLKLYESMESKALKAVAGHWEELESMLR